MLQILLMFSDTLRQAEKDRSVLLVKCFLVKGCFLGRCFLGKLRLLDLSLGPVAGCKDYEGTHSGVVLLLRQLAAVVVFVQLEA